MLLTAALLILLTVLVILCVRKLWKLFNRIDWNRFTHEANQGNDKNEEKAKKNEEEEGAVGGHNHEENEFHHDCSACRQAEGTFVEYDLSRNEEDQGKKEKKKTPNSSSSSKWYNVFRLGQKKMKKNGEEEKLQMSDVSSSSLSLFDIENVGRRRHSGDEL